jgi:hypothetical protein
MEGDYWDGRRKCKACPYGMDQCGNCCDPKWEFTGSMLLMNRTRPREGIIVYDEAGHIDLTAREVGDIGWAAGPRITGVRRFENFDFEAVFWEIDDWNTGNRDAYTEAGGLLYVPSMSTVVPFAETNVEYRHRLYNAEGNVKVRYGEAVNILFGGRVMEFHERLSIDADRPDFLEGMFSHGKAEAANYLYGFQIGADTDVAAWFGIKFNAFIKAGVFQNHIREFMGRESNFFGNDQSEAVLNKTAFVGEAGVDVTWQLHKNLGIFGGYEWMFIDGVVLAPDMISQSGPIQTNTPVYQGAMAGIKVQW